MLKLSNIGARNIDQRSIGLDNAIRDERFHAEVIILYSNALKEMSGEDQSSEVLIDRLQQRLRGGMMKTSSTGMLIAPIAVNSYVVSEISFPSAAKGFNGEHIAFFHALGGLGLDEGDLFVAMDLVAQNVVASDVSNRFDRDNLSIKLHLVTLHYFLDCLTDMIYPGIYASFLGVCSFSFADTMQGNFAYLEPSIGGCLDSREQIIVGRIESHGKGAINNPAADMNSEIHF